MSEQPEGVYEAPRLVTLRTLVLSVVVTWVLSVGAALALPFALNGGPDAARPLSAGGQGAAPKYAGSERLRAAAPK